MHTYFLNERERERERERGHNIYHAELMAWNTFRFMILDSLKLDQSQVVRVFNIVIYIYKIGHLHAYRF